VQQLLIKEITLIISLAYLNTQLIIKVLFLKRKIVQKDKAQLKELAEWVIVVQVKAELTRLPALDNNL
jgi:hypothetical protein